MRKTNLDRKSDCGFTLAEIVVSVGLIGVIAVATMSLMKMVNTTTKTSEQQSEMSIFRAAAGKYFMSEKGCQDLIGTTITEDFLPVEFPGYQGYGKSTQPVRAGFSLIKNKLVIGSLDLRIKPGVTPVSKNLNGVMRRQVIGQIKMSFHRAISTIIKTGDPSSYRKKSTYFEIPLLTDTAGNILQCDIEDNVDQICKTMNLTFDSATGMCKVGPGSPCINRGYYVTVTCDHHTCVFSPETIVAGENNPLTSDQTCPPNSNPIFVGTHSSTRQVDCGKKCTKTVTDTERFYTCLECP